jgi:hypothetical protein
MGGAGNGGDREPSAVAGYRQLAIGVRPAAADSRRSARSGDQGAPGGRPPGLEQPAHRARRPVLVHVVVLAGYLAAGVVVSWPRASYLAGRLPATRDAGSYVWDFWWVAHQLVHLGNPWATRAIAAPVGAQLGLHALMPLPGVLLAPVTVIFGPSASYNLLSAAMPGLLCYATYRVARLWLPSQPGAIAAGAFFGLSSMLVWRSWYHLNLAAGALFIPIALEATVRLTRRPSWRQAVILGAVLAAAVLTDQEIAVLVIIVTILALARWLARRPITAAKLRTTALAALTTLLLASPQLTAIIQQIRGGGVTSPPGSLQASYRGYSGSLPDMFAPSPRIAHFGLGGLGFIFRGPLSDGIPTFGLVLSVLAVAGTAALWRRVSARLLALLWLGCAALALGPVLRVGPHLLIPAAQQAGNWRVSAVMPFTWFARLPGLSGFREPDRLMMLGLLPAALLAGGAVDWLRYHAAPAIVVVAALGVLEAGWSGNQYIGTMPTALPALDGPIAADHSRSIVLDVPFGIRGGTYIYGGGFDPEAQVLATADGHPRSVGYISRVPLPTIEGIEQQPFYARLVAIQRREHNTPADWAAARADARRLHIGWVLVWRWPANHSPAAAVLGYLRAVGFRPDYTADGVAVYRASARWR